MGRKVPLKNVPTQINTDADLDHIFFYLVSVSDPCKEFPVDSERKSRNRKGHVTRECEQQTIGGKETRLCHRSVKCEGLISISSKSGMCCNYKLVRCSWNKYLNDPTLVTNNEKIQTKTKREDLIDKENCF